MGAPVAPENAIEARPDSSPRRARPTSFRGRSAVSLGNPMHALHYVGAKLLQPSRRKIDLVLEMYTPRDYRTVVTYLQTYPFLTDLLLELHGKAQEYFGPGTQLDLEVIPDPEAANHDDFFAFIHSSLPRLEARARLRALDEEWWLDQLDRADCRLTVDVEYS